MTDVRVENDLGGAGGKPLICGSPSTCSKGKRQDLPSSEGDGVFGVALIPCYGECRRMVRLLVTVAGKGDSMELKPEERLAISLSVSPGEHALLLGSGVSSSAGIPTGWAIIQDLLGQLAALREAGSVEEPEEWFAKEFGTRPGFGEILDALKLTEEERRSVLVPYIEGTHSGSVGAPKPTRAHEAIAQLVQLGLVRVILTTNIDRLMEQALQECGVPYDVATSDGAFDGAPALHRTRCLLVKLHGDYREPGVRLAAAELEQYSPSARRLLRRILSQLGLVVCGWSAEWDVALREALLRSANFRFSAFWLRRESSELSEQARSVVSAWRAQEVTVKDANDAFTSLLERARALAETRRAHPQSVEILVSRVRQLAAEDRPFSSLEPLLHEETEALQAHLEREHKAYDGVALERELYLNRIHSYEQLASRLIQAAAATAFYAPHADPFILQSCIQRLAAVPRAGSHDRYSSLQKYPATLVMYASGMAAVRGRRFGNLHSLLLGPEWWDENVHARARGISELDPGAVFHGSEKVLPCDKNYYDWVRPSFYVFDVLAKELSRYSPDANEYRNMFELFEFIYSLVRFHEFPSQFPLLGGFAFTPDYFRKGDLKDDMTSSIGRFYNVEIRRLKGASLLGAGFFDGSFDQLANTAHAHRNVIATFLQERGIG